ncbi:helix-turn-helix transcriptional regulator [Microbispora sp. NPDC088329]|uniref:helix-turn-helix domain-containing protein n=1 Tax=Microbispora sp. NPDC088329 TaxID=3154869 RepID=UPI003412E05E
MTRTTPETHEKEHPTLGALIRAWRARALLTQEQLADRAGVNVRTIGRLEGDVVERPRSASLRRLAEALDLDGRERAALAAAVRSDGRLLVRRLPERCLLVDLSGGPEPGEVLRHLLCTLRPPREATSDPEGCAPGNGDPGEWGRLYRTVLTGHRPLIVLADSASVRVVPACRCRCRSRRNARR